MKKYLSNLKAKINKYLSKHYSVKKSALHLIFWNLKVILMPQIKKKKHSSFNNKLINIGFAPKGAVGDVVYLTKYIYALKKKFGDLIVIDILLNDENHVWAKEIFLQMGNHVNNISLPNKNITYDCELSFLLLPEVEFVDDKRLKHSLFKPFLDYIIQIKRFYGEYSQLYSSGFLARNYSMIHDRIRENLCDVNDCLSMKNIDVITLNLSVDEQVILDKFNLKPDSYITLQTGGGNWIASNPIDTRQWDLDKYNQLILKLKSEYPMLKVIQIGDRSQSIMQNTDLNLLGKTTFLELMIILKNAKLHISQEGGMGILRHFLSKKTSCILFGPANIDFFGFKENINVSANLNCACEGMNEWVKRCEKTSNKPLCMAQLTVNNVIEQIKKGIK